MKYSLVFFLEAQQDILESISWYNSERENLGYEFYEHVREKLILLSESPLHYSVRFKRIRASKVNKYPYLIYFKIDQNSLPGKF